MEERDQKEKRAKARAIKALAGHAGQSATPGTTVLLTARAVANEAGINIGPIKEKEEGEYGRQNGTNGNSQKKRKK